MANKKIPMRTCISCRSEKPKKELIRIVKRADGKILLDKTGKVSGRGAYICNDAKCVEKLIKAKLLSKAFETEVSEETYASVREDFFGTKE